MSDMGFGITDSRPVARDDHAIFFKLKRQRGLIVTLSVPLFLALVAIVQLIPPRYSATAQVTVDSRTPRPPVRGSEVEIVQPFTEDIIGTELAVLSSRELLSQIVEQLHLTEDPHYNPYINSSFLRRVKEQLGLLAHSSDVGPDREKADTLEALTNSIKFTPEPRSRVINIVTSAWNSNLAADISNLSADLYIKTHLGLTQEMNTDANKFLSKRLEELQASATASGQTIETFRQQAGLTAGVTSTLVQEEISLVTRELLEARMKQGTLHSQYTIALTQNPELLTVVVGSQTMSHLRDLQAAAASKEAEIASRFGLHSPQIAAYSTISASLRQQIADESNRAVAGLKNDVAAADANVVLLEKRESDIKQRLAGMTDFRARLDTLQAQSTAAYSLYNAFLNRQKETDASMLFPSTDLRVVSRASAPILPTFPRNIIMLPASALTALVMASLVGFLIESRQTGIVSSSEIETLFHLPTLGILPIREPNVPTVYQDAVENLLNRIYFGLRAKSILITSALPDEGKTSMAKALAEAASARGLRVLLVDGDLRSTSAQKKRNADRGFSEILLGEVAPDDVLHAGSSSNLAILPAGRSGDNPIRLLSLPTVQGLFETLSRNFDLVIIDSPPVLVGGDCWILAQHVDRTILVVKWGHTAQKFVAMALKQLTSPPCYEGQSPKPASDIVLNMVDRSKSRRLDNADSIMFTPSIYNYHG